MPSAPAQPHGGGGGSGSGRGGSSGPNSRARAKLPLLQQVLHGWAGVGGSLYSVIPEDKAGVAEL